MRANVPRRRHKYNAKAAVGIDGFRYDSKGECRRGDELVLDWRVGEVRLLLRQVPFVLPGGTRMILDFVWIDRDHVIHFEDYKGSEATATDAWKVRKREVEAYYDIEIDVTYGRTKR